MLSYRHAFHAGNPADVFKHTVLVALVRALQEKPRGIVFVDTHAGPALIELDRPEAQKNREYERGIERIWRRPGADPFTTDYLARVGLHNPDGNLRRYPGSPQLIRDLLRSNDRAILCELHPAEQQALRERFASDRRVELRLGDGYQVMDKALPPPGGRGLVLIDPPYERKEEWTDLTRALKTALKRFAHGVYAIWYPVLGDHPAQLEQLPARLGLTTDQWMDLRIDFPPDQQLGRMTGCGMALINCPWRLRQPLRDWCNPPSE